MATNAHLALLAQVASRNMRAASDTFRRRNVSPHPPQTRELFHVKVWHTCGVQFDVSLGDLSNCCFSSVAGWNTWVSSCCCCRLPTHYSTNVALHTGTGLTTKILPAYLTSRKPSIATYQLIGGGEWWYTAKHTQKKNTKQQNTSLIM